MYYFFQSSKRFLSNKILRTLYKLIYKYSHPKSYKHNRRYWPYYQVERNAHDELQKIYFKKQLIVDNTQLKNTTHNKCMLITTGPSVQQLEKITLQQPDIDYIGVNGAISLTDITFKYYVIIDHNFTNNRFDLVSKVLSSNCTLFTTARCLDLILRKISFNDIRCEIKVIEPITEGKIERFLGARIAVNTEKEYFYLHQQIGFSTHIFDAVFDYFTVAYVALQICYFLNYKNIYIAGLDMNNFTQPRFYENTENKQPTMLDQYLPTILSAFDTAAEYLSKQDISVYNLSSESAVESFPKLDPKTFLNHQ